MLVGLAMVACEGATTEGWDGAYHSAHFDYLFHADDPSVCPGVMDSLEQHRTLLSNFLGIDATKLPRVTYVKYRDQAELDTLVIRSDGKHPIGYGAKDGVWSPVAFHEHELIHSITLGGWGIAVPFLQEGIATALSCSPSANEITNHPYTLWNPNHDIVPNESSPAGWALNESKTNTLEDYFNVSESEYAAAGAMVTYLLDIAGPETFHRLWTTVPPTASIQEFSSALKKSYGFTLEELWQILQTTRHRPCAPVWMCSFPPIIAGEQGILKPSCTGRDLARTTTGDLRIGYPKFSRSVYEKFATDERINSPVSGISLIACGGDPADQLPRDPAMQYRMMDADIWLPPLTVPHVVTVETMAWIIATLEPKKSATITFQTSSLAPATVGCSGANANLIPPRTTSAIWLPNDGQTRFTRFQLQVQSRGDLFFHASLYNSFPGLPAPKGVEVSLCAGCDGDDAKECNGCPFGTTDCIVKYRNSSPLPLWLRIVAGDYWDAPALSTTPASGMDAVSTMQMEDGFHH